MPSATAAFRNVSGGSWSVHLEQDVRDNNQRILFNRGPLAGGALLGDTLGTWRLTFRYPDPTGLVPLHWRIRVHVEFTTGGSREYVFAARPGGIDLNTLVNLSDLPPDDLAYVGVPGGLVTYDADGDVVNANGTKVLPFVGEGADLSDYPTRDDLADVATSGLYADLKGAPNLAAVALTGRSADLIRPPTISPLAAYQNGTI